MPDDFTDPRDLGGEISGPGGPYDHGAIIIDTSKALLVDHHEIVKLDNPSDGREIIAWLIDGRINQSPDRAKVMFLGDTDFAAAIVTEIHGLMKRMGRLAEFNRLCEERWEEMP